MAGHTRCYQWWAVVLVGVTCAAVRPTYAGQSEDPVADVGGDHLQFHISAGTSPSILFEAGGGDDSSVWTDIAAKVRVRTGARTITYDRAGFGKSDPVLGPYRVEAEVTMLERGLAALEITDDVVLVSHSYGGFLATLFAARHPKRVKGAVFVDANHVSFFTDDVVGALMASMPNARREQRGFRRRCHPDTLALRVENPPQ